MRFSAILELARTKSRPADCLWGRGALWLRIALRITLRPLAAASPPDPTWIPGVYDDGDFDDVVIHIGLLASTADGWRAPALVPDLQVRALVVSGPSAPV